MDHGFEIMIPRAKEDELSKNDFKHEIKFKLFNKEFVLSFQVNQKRSKQ